MSSISRAPRSGLLSNSQIEIPNEPVANGIWDRFVKICESQFYNTIFLKTTAMIRRGTYQAARRNEFHVNFDPDKISKTHSCSCKLPLDDLISLIFEANFDTSSLSIQIDKKKWSFSINDKGQTLELKPLDPDYIIDDIYNEILLKNGNYEVFLNSTFSPDLEDEEDDYRYYCTSLDNAIAPETLPGTSEAIE